MKKRCISIILLLVIVLSIINICSGCSVEKISGINSMCFNFSGKNKNSCDTVAIYQKDEDNFLFFLPGGVNLKTGTLFFSSSEKIYANDIELKNGTVNEVFSATGEYILRCGENEYTLEIVQSSDIPAVFITTKSGSLEAIHADKDYKESGNICIYENGEITLSTELSYIKGRGNMTWTEEKRPYNIKLDESISLFGMEKSKKYCLLSNQFDDTLIRNTVALTIAKKMEIECTSDFMPVDLYINGDYRGNYLLTEKVEVGTGRVDITDLDKLNEEANPGTDISSLEKIISGGRLDRLSTRYTDIPNNPADITGGYLLEIDYETYYDKEENGFVSAGGQFVTVKSPDAASEAEIDYIKNFFNEAEEALLSENGINSQGKHYSEYIDTESLAKMYILQELSANADDAFTSCFFYKEAGNTKLVACCPWDFDQGMVPERINCGYSCNLTISDRWLTWCQKSLNGNEYIPSLYASAVKHTDFRNEISFQWNKYKNIISEDFICNTVFESAELIKNSVAEDFFRWNTLPFVSFDEKADICEENSVNTLKTFFEQRLDYADKLFSEKSAILSYDLNGINGWVCNCEINVIDDIVTVKSFENNALLISELPENCEFVCWNTKSDGTGDSYNPGDEITLVQANTVLYAQWKNN